jgi:hypothetical protein
MRKLQRVRIVQDQDAQSPRENDNLGTMACWHRRYKLGDVQPLETPAEYIESLPKGSIILPLFLFDHSGITISTSSERFRAQDSAGWDWGKVGIIHVSPQQMRENFLTKRLTAKHRETATQVLISEVEEYDTFLTGECYGYIVEEAEVDDEFEDEDEEIEWERVDDCWGFLGRDPFKNGMSEHVPEELHDMLRKAEPEYR